LPRPAAFIKANAHCRAIGLLVDYGGALAMAQVGAWKASRCTVERRAGSRNEKPDASRDTNSTAIPETIKY
jgi:hypothetical protein